MRDVVIVSAVRTPVGRAFKGTLRATRPDELAAIAIKGALERAPQLDPKEIEKAMQETYTSTGIAFHTSVTTVNVEGVKQIS